MNIKMKNIKNGFYLLILVCLFTAKSAWSQQDYVVPIIEAYAPTISDASKINENPQIIDTVYTKSKMFYVYHSKQYEGISYSPDPIKPAKMQPDRLVKLYQNYIRAGFGNYTTPYLEYDYNSPRLKSYMYGVHLKHLSSSGKIKGYAVSGNSDNDINIYGEKFTSNHTYYGSVDFNRTAVRYYGFQPGDSLAYNKKDIKQWYINTGFTAGVKSAYLDSSSLNHSAEFSYYHFMDKSNSSEDNFRLNGNINKDFHFLKFTKVQNIGVDLFADIYNNNDSTLMTGNGVLKLMPYIKSKYSIFDIKLGFNADFKLDVTSEIKMYPIVNVGADLIPHYLYAFAGITGGSKKVSYKETCMENPFVSSILPFKFSNTKTEIFGGIKGNIFSDLSFNLNSSYSVIDSMPFFTTVYEPTLFINGANKFTLIYDNVELLKGNAELTYRIGEKLKLTVGGDYYSYTMKTEKKPWYKPAYDSYLSFDYSLQNKIIVKGDIYYYGDIYGKTVESGIVNSKLLKGYVDANIGLEYRYSKILSAFVNFNNLTAVNNRYYRWLNYPSYKINFLAGITYSFR